jgi:hypothetical protein
MIWLLSSARTGIVEAEPFHAARNLPDLLRRVGMRNGSPGFHRASTSAISGAQEFGGTGLWRIEGEKRTPLG